MDNSHCVYLIFTVFKIFLLIFFNEFAISTHYSQINDFFL